MNALSKPLISVVMPLYNKADLVLEAIASVQAQTVSAWELLVVDDGSTDNGPQQAREVARSDPRVRVLAQANQGVSAARNAGVGAASADIVAFLDADDVWQPRFLEAILALQSRYPTSRWWATGYEIRVADATPRSNRLLRLPAQFDAGVISNYFEVAATSDPPVWTSATAVDRQALLALTGGFPVGVRSGEDLLTWARLAVALPLAYDRRPMAVFRLSGIERRPDPADVVGHALKALHRDHPGTPGLRAYRATWHRMRAAMWLRFDEVRMARIDTGRALRLAPSNPRSLYLWLLCRMPAALRDTLDAWIRAARARIMRSSTSTATPE